MTSRKGWTDRNWYCWRCGSTHNIQTHHILRGIFRANANVGLACLLRLCERCHNGKIHEQPKYWTLTKQLAIKYLHDPEHYDRQKVNEINSLREVDRDRITEQEVGEALKTLLIRNELYLPQ